MAAQRTNSREPRQTEFAIAFPTQFESHGPTGFLDAPASVTKSCLASSPSNRVNPGFHRLAGFNPRSCLSANFASGRKSEVHIRAPRHSEFPWFGRTIFRVKHSPHRDQWSCYRMARGCGGESDHAPAAQVMTAWVGEVGSCTRCPKKRPQGKQVACKRRCCGHCPVFDGPCKIWMTSSNV
jgi:hypothetical protein